MILPDSSSLFGIIHREIKANGPISFARFMELALYCPEFGFYDRFKNTVGHYYTNVHVGRLFGELLALRFAHWRRLIGTRPWQLVEAGAHDGRLAADILHTFNSEYPELFESMEYWILEPSARRRRWQEETTAAFAEKVRWFESWKHLAEARIHGVIFSNELLDAMPVHRIAWDARAHTWVEWSVDVRDGKFEWKGTSCSAEAAACLPKVPVELLAALPDGFTTEICPAATAWWRQAAGALGQGQLLTFDYGLSAQEFLSPERIQGTLRAYRRHHLTTDLLAAAGEQDLTAHVNFTAIQQAGESVGLKTEGLFSQAEFLTRIVQEVEHAESTPARWTSKRVRQFQTLTHPEHLGMRFKVLVQSR